MEQASLSGSFSRYHLWPAPLTRDILSEGQEGQKQARAGRLLARNQIRRLP